MTRYDSDPIFEFVDAAHENCRLVASNMPSEYSSLKKVDGMYRLIRDNLTNTEERLPALFLPRAHSCYLAGVRLAMSCQVYEAYPLVRACLEVSLYAFHFYKVPESIEI